MGTQAGAGQGRAGAVGEDRTLSEVVAVAASLWVLQTSLQVWLIPHVCTQSCCVCVP